MNKVRDEFLTKKIGLTWHETEYFKDGCWICYTCEFDELQPEDSPYIVYHQNTDFSSWNGLGTLVKYCVRQYWWDDFVKKQSDSDSDSIKVMFDPNTFADLIYEYLKDIKENI